MIRWYLSRVVLRRLRTHWLQSLVLALVIALATGILVAVFEASERSVHGFSQGSQVVGSSRGFELHPPSGLLAEKSLAAIAEAFPEQTMHAVLEFLALVQRPEGERRVLVVGADTRHEGMTSNPGVVMATITPATARELGLREGETYSLAVQDRSISVSVEIEEPDERIREAAGLSDIFVVHIADLQDALELRGLVSYALIERPKEGRATIEHELRTMAESRGLLFSTGEARASRAQELLGAFRLNMGIMVALAVGVGIALIAGVSLVYFISQRRELVTLETLGMPRRVLLCSIIGEAWLIALTGALCGVVLGNPLIRWIESLFVDTVSTLYLHIPEAGLRVYPTLREIVIAVGSAILMASIGALVPLWQLRQIRPSLSTRTTVDWSAFPLSRLVVLTVLSFVGALLLAGIAQRYEELVAAHGAALLTIVLTALAGILLGRLITEMNFVRRRSWSWMMAAAALRASVWPTTVIRAMVAMAISAVIGLGLMVDSFRESLRGWLDATLPAELYVRPRAPDDAFRSSYLSPATVETLTHHEAVERVSRVGSAELPWNNRIVTVVGREFHGSSDGIVLVAGRFDVNCLRSGRCGIITEGLGRKLGIMVGSIIELNGSDITIAAIVQDFATERGSLILDFSLFEKLVCPLDGTPPSSSCESSRPWERGPAVRSVALWLKPDRNPVEVAASIQRAVGDAQLVVLQPEELKARALVIFEDTFGILHIMRAMLLVMATLGLGLMMLQIYLERSLEWRLLGHFGISTAEEQRMVMHETVLLCTPAVGAGLVGGVVLSWILVVLVNPLSFGWSYPISLRWESLLYPTIAASTAFALVAILVALFEGRLRKDERTYE